MGFLFGRKKKPVEKPKPDPLAAFDEMIAALERQAGEVRKSAATLLAVRGELNRDVAKYQVRLDDLASRSVEAARNGDAKAERTFKRDTEEAARQLEKTKEALASAEANAQLLVEKAEEIGRQVVELKDERQSAKVRFSAGVAVSETLRAQIAEFDRQMKLDAARDEIEKAHALAELYREDVKR